jgi:hypothetical protein
MTTSCPCSTKWAAVKEPTNPAPPVIRTFNGRPFPMNGLSA